MESDQDLEVNALPDREPVQRLKERSGMIVFGTVKDHPGSRVLNDLQSSNLTLRQPGKERVSIV